MKSLSREKQADIIEAFNSTSRYLYDLLNMDLNLCISNGRVSTKIYDKRDDFDFDIVNFPFLDGDVPRRT